MRILVTGSTGFIGYHAVLRLLAERHDVRVLVRDVDKARRILGPLGLRDDDLVVGDMVEAKAMAQALPGCDRVLHAAASVSVTTGVTNFEDNFLGVENVVGQAVAADVPVVYVSSLTAILTPGRRVDPDGEIARASTHYGRSKARAEQWVRDRQNEGACIAVVYPSAVVGPEDPGFSESVKAYRSFLRGTLQSSGGNQFVDVRDLALVLTRMLEERRAGRVVTAGHFYDWDAFTTLIESVTGAKIPRIRAPGMVLRVAARGLDLLGQWTDKRMPISAAGIEIATRWEEVADSPTVAELGIRWRPPEETIADLFRWFVEAGKLPPRAVPRLIPGAEASEVDDSVG